MAFTDGDLDRLKFHVTGNGPKSFADGIYCAQLVALLARLKAAEKVIDDNLPYIDFKLVSYLMWLKSAGK